MPGAPQPCLHRATAAATSDLLLCCEGLWGLVLCSEHQRDSLHTAFRSETLLSVTWIGFPSFISLLSLHIKSPLAYEDKVTVH